MKMSQYIKMCQAQIETFGDLEVVGRASHGGLGSITRDVEGPSVCDIKEKTPKEWSEKICILESQPRSGEKVFLV